MRNRSVYLPYFALSILPVLGCKKDHPLNMILHDKSLEVIKQKTDGRWVLHYSKGGIISTFKQTYTGVFWEISHGDKIKVTNNNNSIADTSILWKKEQGTYTNGGTTFTMNFSDKLGYLNVYVVDKILNDTLVIHDNSSDAVFYYLTKI